MFVVPASFKRKLVKVPLGCLTYSHRLCVSRENHNILWPEGAKGAELAPLVANLLRNAQADRQVPRLGRGNPRANVIAHPLPSSIRLNAREHIEAGLPILT